MTDQLDKIRSENSVSKQTQSQKEDELRQLDTQLGMKTTTREALDRQKKENYRRNSRYNRRYRRNSC